MAELQMTVTLRFRWWVRAYLAAAGAFLWLMSPFLDEEDADAFVDAAVDFVIKHAVIKVV